MKPFRLFVVVAVALCAASASGRTWTDSRGHQVEGTFVRYFNGQVVLQRAAKVFTIPYLGLSPKDQDYVREQLEAKGQADALPQPIKVPETVPAKPLELGAERTWTDVQGRQIQARFVRASANSVVLLFQGQEVSLPLERFSAEDQQYVRGQFKGGVQSQAPLPVQHHVRVTPVPPRALRAPSPAVQIPPREAQVPSRAAPIPAPVAPVPASSPVSAEPLVIELPSPESPVQETSSPATPPEQSAAISSPPPAPAKTPEPERPSLWEELRGFTKDLPIRPIAIFGGGGSMIALAAVVALRFLRSN